MSILPYELALKKVKSGDPISSDVLAPLIEKLERTDFFISSFGLVFHLASSSTRSTLATLKGYAFARELTVKRTEFAPISAKLRMELSMYAKAGITEFTDENTKKIIEQHTDEAISELKELGLMYYPCLRYLERLRGLSEGSEIPS